MAGASSTNHAETLELTKAAKQVGFDGCMVLPPVYCLPTPREMREGLRGSSGDQSPDHGVQQPGARGRCPVADVATQDSFSVPNVVAYKESAKDLYAVAVSRDPRQDRPFRRIGTYADAYPVPGRQGHRFHHFERLRPRGGEFFNAFRANDADALAQARNQQVIDEMYHLLAGRAAFELCLCEERHGGARPSRRRDAAAASRMADKAQIDKIGEDIKGIYARAKSTRPQPQPATGTSLGQQSASSRGEINALL